MSTKRTYELSFDIKNSTEPQKVTFDVYDGAQGPIGPQGPTGATGPQGPEGPRGVQGEKGEGFSIAKTYSSLAEMYANLNTDNIPLNAFVLINTGNVQDEENAKLYIRTEDSYSELADLSGAQGIQGETGPEGPQGKTGKTGPQGPQGIQGVQGEKGDKGDKGDTGETGPQGPQGNPGTSAIHSWNGTTLTITSASGTSSANLKGETGNDGYTPQKGVDYFTTADKQEFIINTLGVVFNTFPTPAEFDALADNTVFTTLGFYSKGDGNGSTYKVISSSSSPQIGEMSYGTAGRRFKPCTLDSGNKDIPVELYGIRPLGWAVVNETNNAIIEKNSTIMDYLGARMEPGYTLTFKSGHYFFNRPFVFHKYNDTTQVPAVNIKGTCSNAEQSNTYMTLGTLLRFIFNEEIYTNAPIDNKTNQKYVAAVPLTSGMIQDIGIRLDHTYDSASAGSYRKVYLNREKWNETDKDANVISTNIAGYETVPSYGLYGLAGSINNVRIVNFDYGIYNTVPNNSAITNIDIRQCRVGISVINDTKISNVQLFNVLTGIQLRGPLASAVNIRGDSIGKHLIECWHGKCILSNIDGDWCLGSLIHYGSDEASNKYIHLGSVTGAMGRVAIKNAYQDTGSENDFDLQNVSDEDYEYCSYISIHKNTYVFGGLIDLISISARHTDTSSPYKCPPAIISIGEDSTVKDLSIKCTIPENINVDYFNKNIIKNLSNYAVKGQNATNGEYLYNFDGTTIESIGFITSNDIIKSYKEITNNTREISSLRFPKYTIPNIQIATSVEDCVDKNSIYILPSGELFTSYLPAPYTNQLAKVGYQTNATISASSSNYGDIVSSSLDTYAVTGFIPVKPGDTVYIRNMTTFFSKGNAGPNTNTTHGSAERVTLYDTDKNALAWHGISLEPKDIQNLEEKYKSQWQVELDNEDIDKATRILSFKIPTGAYSSASKAAYIRICFIYHPTDDPLYEQTYYFNPDTAIITVDENPDVSTSNRRFGKLGFKLTPITE